LNNGSTTICPLKPEVELLKDKLVDMLAVYGRGGEYPLNSEAEPFDLQKKYVELIFGFMGFEDIRSVVVKPTLQGGPDVAEAKRQKAINKAREMATAF
jgi:FMN-dependent NADH-azoreductase